MKLFRVNLPNGPRWMASNDTFRSKSAKVSMQAIRNSQLYEQEPLNWIKHETNKLEKEKYDVSYGQLLAPLPGLPPMVYGLGLNYAAHSAETKMDLPRFPIVIGKAPTSLIGPNQPIAIPRVCNNEVDFEVELAVVIGKPCKNVSKDEALDYVLGYTCGNDVSARKWQGKKGGGQWTRAKSFDTFMPLGPGIAILDSEINGPLELKSLVGKGTATPALMQHANTSEMIFNVASLVEFLSQGATLHPWTVILTGTPAGVGYTRNPPVLLEPGDNVQIEIEGIGALWNPVEAEK